jgi:solute carrier family 25, member 33/36
MDSKNKSFSAHFIAGGLAGTVGATLLCPLEVVKTRLQSSLYKNTHLSSTSQNPFRQIAFHMNGVVQLLAGIRKEEGIRALWKGLGPNLIGIVPARYVGMLRFDIRY